MGASPPHQPGLRYRLSTRDLWLSATAAKIFVGWFGLMALIALPLGHYSADSTTDGLVLGLVLAPALTWSSIVVLRANVLRIDERRVSIGTPSRSKVPIPPLDWSHVPVEQVVRFEVRHWTEVAPRRRPWMRAAPASSLSMLYPDGTWQQVWGFNRSTVERRGRVVLSRRAWRRPYRAIRSPEGRTMRWTPATDIALETLLNAHLAACRGDRPMARAPVNAPAHGGYGAIDHHRRVPAVRRPSDWLSEALHGRVDPPVVPQEPLPPPPPPPIAPEERPTSATRLWAGHESPKPAAFAFPDLRIPTRYWTLASTRSGSLAGGLPSMQINAAGVTFSRRLRRDLRVPLGEIDRFDIAFDAIPMRDPWDDDEQTVHGNWRLLLFRTDGTTVPLSGLDHGYFRENELFWSTAESAGAKLPTPEGSMPWPNDQPLEVAARLNAHLEVARRVGGGATTSVGGPAG